MTKPNDDAEEDGLNAPAKLLAVLRQPPDQPIFVPRSIDGLILRAAQRQLIKNESPRLRWIPLLRWSAVFAALVVAGIFFYHHARYGPNLPPRPAFVRDDINHDGRVDILDAFLLAKRLHSGPAPEAGLDINGDGVVDGRDVETIAARAVKLEKGGHS